MTLTEMVKGNKVVRFLYYRDKELWYVTEDGFQFPVPISDTGTGTFKAEDKAILYMRWIRKHLEDVKSWREESLSQPQVLSGVGSNVEELPEGEEMPDEMTPQCCAANAKLINSIIHARIPEDAVLRFSEEDMEDML
jgi:hypothetical protein